MSARRRIVLLGASGQVGGALTDMLASRAELVVPPPVDSDFGDPDRLARCVRDCAPEVIVNAAAYTQVDLAERERVLAHTVNARAPGALAEIARELGALLVHYSTDYVFNGEKGSAYVEDDVTGPLNVYGESKRAGELAVLASGAIALVLRTSWVYGLTGDNFLLTVRRLAAEHDQLRMVDDQRASPTWSVRIARATASLIDRMLSLDEPTRRERAGIYHMSALGAASWYDFARAIVAEDPELASRRDITITPVPTSEFPRPAARPRYSLLDCRRLQRAFGIDLGDWREGLREALSA